MVFVIESNPTNLDARCGQVRVLGGQLSGDGFVAPQRGLDLNGRDGTFAAETPVVAAELDNCRGHSIVGFAAIQDQRDAVAKLSKNVGATRARR